MPSRRRGGGSRRAAAATRRPRRCSPGASTSTVSAETAGAGCRRSCVRSSSGRCRREVPCAEVKSAYTLFAVSPSKPVSRADLQEVASGCACLSVRRAARAMSRAYDDELRETGLRMTQVSTLVAVGLHGEVTGTRLAEPLDLDRTTLTRELKPLHERGLLTVRAGDDRRSRIVELTDAGREALTDAIPRWRAAQRRALAGIDATDWHTLLGHLDRAAAQAAG